MVLVNLKDTKTSTEIPLGSHGSVDPSASVNDAPVPQCCNLTFTS